MATYGSIPGVRISTSTGTISGVTIGREQYLLLAGIGDENNATVDPNEVVQLEGNADVDEKFGEESDLANAYRRAIANGANPDFVRAVRAEVTSQVDENFTSSTGTLAEGPIVADPSRITATDVINTTDLTVVFEYGSPPGTPGEGEIVINPYSKEFEADADEVDITYDTADWETAINEYKRELVEGEFGILNPLTANPTVGQTLQGTITAMRDNLKMVLGILGAEYNATENEKAFLDAGEFENSFSDDTLWLVGPTLLRDSDVYDRNIGALSAVSGLMAGNDTTEPVYDSTVSGIGELEQRITRSDVKDLRGQYVAPLRDVGITRLEDNRSTYNQSEEGGWERDYFRRRIVDLTMVTMYLIARRQIGGILDSDTVEDVQDAVNVELSNLVEDRLLEPGEQNVSVYRADDRTIGMDLVIAPLGVAKGADIELEINA